MAWFGSPPRAAANDPMSEHTSVADLERMANQIARQFEPYGHDEAVAGIQRHMTMFWTPAMRAAAAQALESGDIELIPAAAEAVGSFG